MSTDRLPVMRAAARRDEGMTLIEMLVGISAAMFVILGAYAAMSAASKLQMRTSNRIEAAQRGRAVMETITRDVRAQMCLPTKSGYTSAPTPAIVWASGDGIEFYASVAPPATGLNGAAPTSPGDTAPPERRRLEWVQTGTTTLNGSDSTALPVGTIVETVWRATNTVPPYTFPTSPTRKLTLAKEIEHSRDANGNVLPIFQYYGYDVVDNMGRPSNTPFPLVASATSAQNPNGVASVDPTNLGKIVLINIAFSARPFQQSVTNATQGNASRPTVVVPFSNRVSVRTADPQDPKVSPLCL